MSMCYLNAWKKLYIVLWSSNPWCRMVTQLVYSDVFRQHDTISHPENAERTMVMTQALQDSPLMHHVEIIDPIMFPEKLLYEIHSERMINLIKEISESHNGWVDLVTYICRHDFETARFAVGATLQLCNEVLKGTIDNGFAMVRPPGHHATSNTSMGFCLFNNAALAAQQLVKKKKKVLIFDMDVHHGNGTQEIFYKSDKVMYQSFHLSPHFPGTGKIDDIGESDGAGYTVNAPLSYGNGDTAIKALMDEIFLPIASQFKPDIIIASSGFDSHHADPLGGLCLTVNMFGTLIEQLLSIQSKLVCTLEGGYNLSVIGNCLLSQLGVMCKNPVHYMDNSIEMHSYKPVIEQLKKNMKQYWDV